MFSKLKRITSGLLATIMLITLIPATTATLTTTAYAADGSGDYIGDGQDSIAGQDATKDNKWDGHSGAWRIYVADEAGNIKYGPKDVSDGTLNGTPISFMTMKIRDKNATSISSAGVSYEPLERQSIPSLTASQDEIIAFWESNNFEKFRVLCNGMGWPADEIIPKVQSTEWFIVIEPVGWFTMNGAFYAVTPTECAIMHGIYPQEFRNMLSFTHNYLPGRAWFNQLPIRWGIPIGFSFNPDGMKYQLPDSIIRSTFGIARVEATGGMCCPHNPTNCDCYKHATPPNQDPTNAPDKCKCFETHLKDPNNPIPCGPGVPGCDCYPPQCCEHPPNCPCGPGDHPTNDPNEPSCICPETHPNRPCSPDEPECDCFPSKEQVSTWGQGRTLYP